MKQIIISFIFINSFLTYSQEGMTFCLENSTEFNFQPSKTTNDIKPFSVFHEQILLCGDLGQHRIFLGPQYSYFSGYLYDPIDDYRKNAFGINLGYQYNYLIKNRVENTSIIARLSFSLYEYKTTEYSQGTSSVSHVKTIIENNFYIGLQKQFQNKLYIQGGLGFGSTQGFFLMIESFMLSSTFSFGIKL